MRVSRGLRSLAPLDAAIVAHCRSMRHAGRGPLHAGLALRPQLTAAQGFRALAAEARRRADRDVAAITANDRAGRHGDALRLIDNVSNDLCRVLDLTEFLRQVHPEEAYRQAATEAHVDLAGYMSELNANEDLYNALKNFSLHPESMDEEAERSTAQLLHDFEAAGIALPPRPKAEVVQLIGKIDSTRMTLEELMSKPGPALELEGSETKGLTKLVPLERNGALVTIPYHSLRSALSLAESPYAREKIAEALYAATPELDDTFTQLLAFRYGLAKRVGFASSAHKELALCMAQKPTLVLEFLDSLSDGLKGILPQTMQSLGAKPEDYKACHISFLLNMRQRHVVAQAAAPYLSLSTAVAGASFLMQEVFNVSLKPTQPAVGETWHPSVWKFHVVEPDGTVLGDLYCDFFARPSKNGHASHYTLQSFRGLGTDGDGRKPQRPQVALVCGFAPPRTGSDVTLSYNELYTLFHELGHALHSFLSETTYQNVSGTRGSLDFGEVPSSLFELFLRDEVSLSAVARHHSTGEPMPLDLARSLIKDTFRFQALELDNSLLLSAMDQHYHSREFQHSGQSLLEGLAEVSNRYSFFKFDNAARYSRFDHIVSYGSIYYSYLWCQALASLLWRHCFAENPLNSEAGASIRRNILSKGSGRSPWLMMEAVLGGRRPMASDLSAALLSKAREGGVD